MACEHADKKLTRRNVRTGAVQYVYQCMECGRSMNQPISHERVRREFSGVEIIEFDEDIEGRYERRRVEAVKEQRAQERASFFGQYDEYLKGDAWHDKRRRVFLRCKGVCEGCGINKATEVHHLTYEHVFDELLFELVGVCDPCHKRAHADKEGGNG